ncbi:MAG: hypothetical protein HOM24_02325, partial [Flavobacteriales bacterium]|nr:hypothetical protein [Flavobacteriales bacterium]
MRYIVISIIAFISTYTYSQNTFNYLGALVLANNSPISFSLELKEDNGIVNGYSITNINTPDETKSEISGLYFKEDKSFQLQETQILQTKSEAALNTFCYINMTLSFKGRFGSKRLEGAFTGNYLDSTECASGRIILMERTRKTKKKVEKKYNERYQDTSLVKKTQILKDGDDFTINWEGNKLKLFIWDANMEDGDKIQITINGNIILDNFETTNKRKKIKYKLVDGENIIEIKATNLGTSPPNTSRIELVDNKTKYLIINQLE